MKGFHGKWVYNKNLSHIYKYVFVPIFEFDFQIWTSTFIKFFIADEAEKV
jgi:hypothetical protein